MKRTMAQMWFSLAVGVLLTTSLFGEAGPGQISSQYGTLRIEDRASFDFYADRNNFPGAMQMPEVKFTITGVDTPTRNCTS